MNKQVKNIWGMECNKTYTFNGNNWLIAQPEKAPITRKYISYIRSIFKYFKNLFTKKYDLITKQ